MVVIQFNAFLENTHIFQNNTIMGQFLIKMAVPAKLLRGLNNRLT